MARKRSKSVRKLKRNNEQAIRSGSVAFSGAPDSSPLTQDVSGVPDEGPKRSAYTVAVGSPRPRHIPNSFSSDGVEGAESDIALKRNRHSLLPQAFEVKRVERWLNKGKEAQFEWASKYLRKAFRGFPLPIEVTSNKETVAYWFNLPDVSGAVKSKLFGQMTNAWYQKVKRAKRKAEGVHSVELSSRRMEELRSMASEAEITVMQALGEIVKVAYENKKQFRRQSAKMKKEAIERMKLEIRGGEH
jgi:Xaa-Pro aminopeptidase